MTTTFDYCWAESGVDGSSWLQSKMIWGSTNDAYNGGMTHAAFADAAQLHWSLLSQLDLPYNEEDTAQPSEVTLANACSNSTADDAAASISGWEQVVGRSCENSSDSTELLKLALQQQPISVAINSDGSFDANKGGIYACPNDGDFVSSTDINHAVVLVGYGSDGTTDYWIIKNSYGTNWAGLAHTAVDSGGAIKFLGMAPESWIILGIAVAVVTVFLTVIGVLYASRQRNAYRVAL
ncbi:unnamed protein product [Peronospora effusa]|nr:unnamed protein product [Peronospora effusa]